MSYQKERDEFISRVTKEGLPGHVARLLLREATGLNRRAELACSSEAADRDRVPCPASKARLVKSKGAYIPMGPCLCDDYPAGMHAKGHHTSITRIALQDWRAEERIRKALADVNATLYKGRDPVAESLPLWGFKTEGDPRGYVLRVIPPSYAERNAGRDIHNLDAIGVPNGPSGLRF